MADSVHRRLAAILAADVVGYSLLMGEDEIGTRASFNSHLRELVEPTIGRGRGRIVKTTGDALLVEFASVVDAVSCAVEIQNGMFERNSNLSDDRRIEFRIGVNLGDVIIEGDDIHGDGVNVASRLEGLANPGGVIVSRKVYEEIRGKLNVEFEDLGPQEMKNIAEQVHVYSVKLGGTPRKIADPAQEAPDDSLPLPEKPSIAVLPFVNMSGDPEQEFFTDGITEDIITDLSKVSGLFVIGRQSSFVYKGKSVSLRQVGSELGVRYVLEGSVRKAGNRVRITAQLIESKTDNHVWADRYDRELEDIFEVQEEVARKVVDALAVTLMPEEGVRLGQAPTENREAYDALVRGRKAVHPPAEDNLAHACKLFESTIALDPEFGGGYAGLSYVGSLRLLFGYVEKTPAATEEVVALAEKAVALDDTFGWSFTALGWARWIEGRHDEAIAAAQRAVDLQPSDPETHGYLGLLKALAGAPNQAIPDLERAIRLNPRSPGQYLNYLGYANTLARNYDTAISAFNAVVPGAYSPMTYAMLILAYFESGDTEKAKETASFALDRYPRLAIASFVSLSLRRRVDVDRFIEALRASGIPD